MALDDYGYYDENGKFIKFKAGKHRRKGSKTYHAEPIRYKIGNSGLMDELDKIIGGYPPESDRPDSRPGSALGA